MPCQYIVLLLTSYKHISTAGTLSRQIETAPWLCGSTQHGTGRSRWVDIWAAPVLLSQTGPRETPAHPSALISASGGHTHNLGLGSTGPLRSGFLWAALALRSSRTNLQARDRPQSHSPHWPFLGLWMLRPCLAVPESAHLLQALSENPGKAHGPHSVVIKPQSPLCLCLMWPWTLRLQCCVASLGDPWARLSPGPHSSGLRGLTARWQRPLAAEEGGTGPGVGAGLLRGGGKSGGAIPRRARGSPESLSGTHTPGRSWARGVLIAGENSRSPSRLGIERPSFWVLEDGEGASWPWSYPKTRKESALLRQEDLNFS